MSKSQERGGTFVPKPDLLRQIMEMGFSKNAAIKGLYHTRNGRADAAISWIFDNNTRKDLDDPLEIHVVDTAGSDEEDNGMAAFLQASDFYKMVLVVNCELKMGTGKTAAQVGHAAIGLYKNLVSNPKKYGPILHQWEEFGESKIVLKGRHTQQLLDLCSKATSLNLPTYLVEDAGKTEVEQGVITVLSIMGKGNIVDMVTEELSLL